MAQIEIVDPNPVSALQRALAQLLAQAALRREDGR